MSGQGVCSQCAGTAVARSWVVTSRWLSWLLAATVTMLALIALHTCWYISFDYSLPGDRATLGLSGVPPLSPCGDSTTSTHDFPRLAVIATLKPFDADPECEVRQHNAVNSWRRSYPGARVYLVGSTADAVAKKWGVDVLAGVEITSVGTPLLSSMITVVMERDPAELIMFANADIVATPGIRSAVKAACRAFGSPFLLIGQRFEIPLDQPLPWADVGDEKWTQRLLELEAHPSAYLKDVANKDYFVFPRSLWPDGALPALVVGRAEVDNYMVQDVLTRGLPVVDVTPSLRMYHVTHRYSHLGGGKDEAWHGAEAQQNRAIMRSRFGAGRRELSHTWHTTYQLRCRESVEHSLPDDAHCALAGRELIIVPRSGGELWRQLFLAGFFHFKWLHISLAVAGGSLLVLRIAYSPRRRISSSAVEARRRA